MQQTMLWDLSSFGPPKQQFSLDAGGSKTILHGKCWFHGQHEGEYPCLNGVRESSSFLALTGYSCLVTFHHFSNFSFRTQVVVDVGGVPLTLQSIWP